MILAVHVVSVIVLLTIVISIAYGANVSFLPLVALVTIALVIVVFIAAVTIWLVV